MFKSTMSLVLPLVVLVMCSGCSHRDSYQQSSVIDDEAQSVYLFSSFRGNGNDGLHLSYSVDGLNWHALNQDNSVLTPQVGGKLMRDPCIILGPDNLFHMVWTSSWEDGGIGIAHSKDLIHWSEQQFIPVMVDFPTAKNSWAPEIFWDETEQRYFIYWASTIPGKYPETEVKADKGWDHRIYATTTADFKTYSKTTLFYQPDFNVIDSTITKLDDKYVMVLKDETRYPPAKNLRVATSDSIWGPWQTSNSAFTQQGKWLEGPTITQVNDWYHVYFDEYIDHQYGAMRTRDFTQWQTISTQLQMPTGSRHGTVVKVSQQILQGLIDHYASKPKIAKDAAVAE